MKQADALADPRRKERVAHQHLAHAPADMYVGLTAEHVGAFELQRGSLAGAKEEL